MSFADTLRTHEEQAERRRHRIFFDEFFCNQFCFFDRTIARRKWIEIVELAVRVPKRNLCVLEKAVGPRRLDAFAAGNAFNSIAKDFAPAGAATARANLCRL